MSIDGSNMDMATGGTEVTRLNALRHGVLSRYTVLPWEDRDEYQILLDAFAGSTSLPGRPRNTSSRSWPGSSGASAGFASPRPPHTGMG